MSAPEAAPTRTSRPITFEPIGWVCSPYQRRFGTPQQAAAVDSDAEAVLKLDPDRIPLAAVVDLAGMERVWVLSYLDRGAGWSAQVVPPRGPRVQRSLFATRSPDRPNPIGLSALRLVRVEGWDIHVRGIDLLDGTPILDIKPYIPYCDAFPNAKAGWLDEVAADSLQYAKR